MPTRSGSPRDGAVRRRFAFIVALVALLAVASSPAAAAKKKAKASCAPGTVPAVTGSGRQAKVKTVKGKPACKKEPKLVKERIEVPAQSSQGTIATTTDQLDQALTVNPQGLDRIEKKVGRKAARALMTQAMDGWRTGAGVAARARRLADDSGLHIDQRFGDPAKGTQGSAKIDVVETTSGGQLGFTASGTVEFQADAAGLKSLGADKVTNAKKGASVKIEVAFADTPTACPTADGKVAGTLTAFAKITITTDGVSQSMSAKVTAKYTLTVGDDARWKTIDDVDVISEFQFAATGEPTTTWRGRRVGGGFTSAGIFGEGAGDFTQAIAEQSSHISENQGGVWGPKSSVNFAETHILWDLHSIDNVKGMIYTSIASEYLTYAAVEYVRQVVAKRLQKHWYDDEACLKLTGKPAKAKLGAGEKTNVTASDAKAANGVPAAVAITATGVASITPGSAQIPASGTKDFELTAPNSTPTRSSWQFVGLSKAGKKTVSGTLADEPKYTITLDDTERGHFDLYDVSAKLTGTITTTTVAGSAVATSAGTGPLLWQPTLAQSHEQYCELQSPVSSGSWAATVEANPDDTVTVTLALPSAQLDYTYSCDFPPSCSGCEDPPPVSTPGMAGARPVGFAPLSFKLPSAGGIQTIDGELSDGGTGFFSDGTVTVTPTG